jgi:hypothetical protein
MRRCRSYNQDIDLEKHQLVNQRGETVKFIVRGAKLEGYVLSVNIAEFTELAPLHFDVLFSLTERAPEQADLSHLWLLRLGYDGNSKLYRDDQD